MNVILAFTCTNCGAGTDERGAKLGCGCGSGLFKVSRIIFRNPYRTTHDPEDGYKVNNPLAPGEMGESGLGTIKFRDEQPGYDDYTQNNYLPRDGSEYDDSGIPGNSDKLMDGPDGDYNPLEPMNTHKDEPYHLGPHNMTDVTQNRFLEQQGEIFERIRRKRKEL